MTPRKNLIFSVFLIISILLGGGFRLYLYLLDIPFWFDEARTVAFLAGELSWVPGITWPRNLLFTQELLVKLVGINPFVLRFFPLLLSLILLFVWYRKVRDIFGKNIGNISTIFLLLNPTIIQFSFEYKQYMFELFISSIIFLYFFDYLRVIHFHENVKISEEYKQSLFFKLLTFSIIGIIFSYSQIYIVASYIGLILLINVIKKYKRRNWLKLLIASKEIRNFIFLGIGVLSIFLLEYFTQIKKNLSEPWLVDYWNGYYYSFSVPIISQILWLYKKISKFIINIGFITVASRLIFVSLIVFSLDKIKKISERYYFIFVTIMMGLIFLASVLHKYPFGGRPTIFVYPILILGASILINILYERSSIIASGIFLYLICILVIHNYHNIEVFSHRAYFSNEVFQEINSISNGEFLSESDRTVFFIDNELRYSWQYYVDSKYFGVNQTKHILVNNDDEWRQIIRDNCSEEHFAYLLSVHAEEREQIYSIFKIECGNRYDSKNFYIEKDKKYILKFKNEE